MNRRTFLAAVPVSAACLATLKAPLLVPVDWNFCWQGPGGRWDFNWRTCDFCHECFADDIHADRPIRQFYESTDEDHLCVCEHCIGAYMEDAA